MLRRIGLLASALAAMGLAAGLAIGGAGTARADSVPPPPPQNWSEIFNPYLNAQGNTLCWDDPSGSTAEGQKLQLWRCHGYAANGAPQRWEFSPVTVNGFARVDPMTGNRVYHIYNDAAHKCLDLPVGPSSQLTLGSCTQDLVFNFELISDNAISQNGLDFQVGFENSGGGVSFCAGASNFTDNNGTALVLESCSAYDTGQIWRLG